MADPPGSSPALASRPTPSPAISSASPRFQPSVESQMAPPATASQSQFYRFRLGEFQRVGTPTTAPPGQCSRFRVSNFVPYGAEPQNSSPGQSVMNGGSMSSRPRSSSGQGSSSQLEQTGGMTLPGTGSFSVMHMDLDREVPQVTSNSVAATGGRGLLKQKGLQQPKMQTQTQTQTQAQTVQEHMSPQAKHQSLPVTSMSSASDTGISTTLPTTLPTTPMPMPTTPMQTNSTITFPPVKFEPSQYPEDLRYELARVLGNIQRNPTEFITKITTALLSAPSLEEKSFLRHICSLYPTIPPPPVPLVPQMDSQTPSKRKRGRPPGKKKSNTATPNTPTTQVAAEASMAPPPTKQQTGPMAMAIPDSDQDQDLNSAQSQQISVIPACKSGEVYETCTRCLKQFNPAWRTLSSDPTSEVTCAVPHPYPDHASGLVVSLPVRKRTNYKTTWRWRCCGREVQSAIDELQLLPNKEDDKTGGWCFVGRHTLEPGVREKLGLKTGKGRTIEEVADIASDSNMEGAKKRARIDPSIPSEMDDRAAQNSQSGQSQQLVWPPPQESGYIQGQQIRTPQPKQQLQQQQQSQPSPTQPETQTSEPQKRKRGRPKGSRSKAKSTSVPPGSADTTSPETQLLTEASQPQHRTTNDENHLHVSNGDTGSSSFWTQYTEPHLPDLSGDADDNDTMGVSEGRPGGINNLDINPVDLGMLVNATAAMRGDTDGAMSSPTLAGGKTPAKRGRGRPKGVKNGTGRAAVEKKRLEQEAQQQAQQQAQRQQQQQQQQEQEQTEDHQHHQQVHHQHHHHHHHATAVTNGGSAAEVTNLGAGGGWFPGDEPWASFS